MRVVLASTSRYRRELLARLLADFDVESPGVDEAARPGESGPELAERLAREKALAVARRRPADVVIGSDQVLVLEDGTLLGKPGDLDRARAQLRRCAGRSVRFETGVAVARGAQVESARVPTTVRFRPLEERDLEAYLAREPALDAAGSFKSEGLGIVLFESLRSDDPTALVGLPLIATCELLRRAGVDPLRR